MPLVDSDHFGEAPCARIYISGSLSEAKRVEAALSDAGIDYTVEIEKFGKKLLGVIPREYNGAAFYVLATQAESCRRLLVAANLRMGLVEDESDGAPGQ